MRLTSRTLTRGWMLLAAAVITAAPVSVSATAAEAATGRPSALPHAVGGLLPSAGRTPARVRGGAGALDVLPTSVDLRSYAPSPGDQGQIGSCVAWSIGYSIMGYYANRTSGAGAPYAPLFLYMRNVAPGGAPNAGLNPDAVLANAQSAGVDTQSDYWQGTTNWQSAPTAGQIANARNYRVSGWTRLFNGAGQGATAKTSIMQALASGSPVALGIPVFRDFMYLRTHTVYSTLTGTNLGGHMIAAYGYDAQGVLIRNSWGTGWGNAGDAKLSWDFVTRQVSGAYTVSGITTPAAPVAIAPTVAALSVAKGTAGTSVTITGAGLAGATSVRFGATAAQFEPVTSGGVTKLVAVAPAHAIETVDVTVSNDAGTSATGPAGKFTYVPPPPGITGLSPASVLVFGGQTVTLTGTDLTGVTAVKIGTSSAPAKAVTATSLSFAAPAKTAGTYPVTVTNKAGTSTTAGSITYENPPPPVVAALTPAGGLTYRTTPVVVTGTYLTGVTKVTVDGRNVPFAKVSDTQLKVTLPAHAAGQAALRITTPGGENTTGSFTYVAPPVPEITSVTPNSGFTYARTPVVVTGANFTESTKLTVGGVTVPYTKVSDTQLKVTLPVHAAGAFQLRLTTPGGTTAEVPGAQFTWIAPPPPAVTALSTTTGSTRTTTTVTVTGTNLTAASKVTAGTATVPFVRVSDTTLRLTVPARAAGPASIVVTTPGGVSEPASFAFVAPAALSARSHTVPGGTGMALFVY
ncbi:IPT/TIG domain-containing protein [Couchioplanes caeruleus]|uniref:IPT/TIG domain-containing protein n=1 Tax=Couchioplanes caeruleus TaxID=56438 RepID=UPI0020C1207C|nr:IPT/TIG domain-containing protein [Couchioplanes caeruleus]UQU66518.1 IPT/TIG domain-containing protein [Couchioplanes caeruleus]